MIEVRKYGGAIFLFKIFNKLISYLIYLTNFFKVQIVASKFKFCGEEVVIDYDVWFNNAHNISIGSRTFIGKSVLVNAIGEITIGSRCGIAAGSKLISGNYVHDNYEKHIFDEMSSSPIILGNDVWLGYGVTILAGVTLGEGCIVSAGSVVTKSFDRFSIISGIPAKKIGSVR